MNASLINEIKKAKRFAEEPERIQFTKFETTFRGDDDVQTATYNKGEWNCTCQFFHDWDDCSHTMAMQRVLGVTIPAEHRHGIPASLGTVPPIQNQKEKLDLVFSTIVIQDMRIRITELPLTPQNLITIFASFTELYTKCWLIMRGRFADLIEFTQTRNNRFIEEANLTIPKITQNSPLNIDWKLDASPQGLMQALATGIDAITQASHRVQSVTLENREKELTCMLKELETQSELTDKEQARQIAAQKAELEKQATLLEIERQRLEVVARRLEVEKMRMDYALQIAEKMVYIMRPEANEETRTLLLQTLIPNLLQLGEGIGLELVLPAPQISDNALEKGKENVL